MATHHASAAKRAREEAARQARAAAAARARHQAAQRASRKAHAPAHKPKKPAAFQRTRPHLGRVAGPAIRIRCRLPRTDVSVMLGDGPVKIAGGVGGWDLVERPRQVSMTQWKGVEPWQVSIPIQFEGWLPTARVWGQPDGVDMNDDIYELLTCARGDDEHPPGIVSVAGVVLPATRWVIENLEFGDDVIIRPSDKATLRQSATLTLREYVPPEFLRVSKRGLEAAKARTKIYVVRATASKHDPKKRGESPAAIAKKLRCKWTDLRQLNPSVVKKASQHLKIGTKLRVPVEATKPHKAHGKRKAAGAKHHKTHRAKGHGRSAGGKGGD